MHRRLNFGRRIDAWLIFFLASFIIYCPRLAAQSNQHSANNESDGKIDSIDPALSYEIQSLKIELVWSGLSLRADFVDLAELKEFAREAAESGDYDLALIYMTELFASLEAVVEEESATNSVKPTPNASPEAATSFTKEISFGMDFSEQQYNLTFGASDSTFLESLNNPFTGVTLRWNQFRADRYNFELGGLVKYSRDYTMWQALSRVNKSNLLGLNFQLEQQWEGLDYQRSLPIQYWQSYSEIQLSKEISDYFIFSVEDEFQYRGYRDDTESFPTYWRNEFQVFLRSANFWNSRFSIGYDLDQRWQKTFTIYDYFDQRFNFQHSFFSGWKTSLMTWYQFREMDYTTVISDSTFLADFRQHYASMNLKQGIFRSISLTFSGESILRNYPESALFTPDFQFFRLEPGLSFQISNQFTLGVDYLFESKNYDKTQSQKTDFFLNENLSSQGVTFSVDYFNYRNFLLTLSHTFRFESYPNAPDNPIPGFSLYTDRVENSTLMYLSYQFSSGLEVTMILQHDLDRDREIEHNDSRSSIFSLDFNWRL